MTAAGNNHSLFLTKEGRMYACGYNQYGELGITIKDKSKPASVEGALLLKCKPIPLIIESNERMRFIEAGAHYSLAISTHQENGVAVSKLFSWGLSDKGQLGNYEVRDQYNL